MNSPLVSRYFESHPVEYITTALFFVGLAALVMKTIGLFIQGTSLEHPLLETVPDGGQPIEDAGNLLKQLDGAPNSLQSGYLVSRLRSAIEYVRRKGSAESLDGHLLHLADEDYGRMQSGFALVRIVIWAIPILGFLGTVIGITLAIAQLSPQALEDSLSNVTGGLGVAFDTTALALSLSIVLMFTKFFVEQAESKILTQIDKRVHAELVGRFQQLGAATDPHVASIQRASGAIVAATDDIVRKQAEIWKETIDEASTRWTTMTETAGKVLEKALAGAVAESIDRHAAALEDGIAEQTAKIAGVVSENITAIAEATDKHAESLTSSAEQHLSALRHCLLEIGTELAQAIESHGNVIDGGAERVSSLLSESMARHADVLAASLAEHRDAVAVGEQALAEENRRYLSEVQLAIVEAAASTLEQSEQLVKQGEVLLKVVDATGQVTRLEETLNGNLAALANSHNFEETVTSLAAAIQLLSSRLGQTSKSGVAAVQLEANETQTFAAA